MSDVQNEFKKYVMGFLVISMFVAPLYSVWGFLHRGLPWFARYFTWVAAHMETMIALIAMVFIWIYMKDFKKIFIVGAIVYLFMLSPSGSQFLH